MDVLTLKNS